MGSQALVAHACNPSYLGGRDQEDYRLRPARPYLKNTQCKKELVKSDSSGRALPELTTVLPKINQYINKCCG
jgi:hypothetical protein